MKDLKVRKITFTALFAAIICVMTFIVRIPTANGYLNLGDCGVLTAAVLGGPFIGGIAGGLGSALADILSGYTAWALPTFIIKGVMGLVVGKFAVSAGLDVKNLIVMIIAGVWMVVGYYAADIIVFGSETSGFVAAITAMIPNVIQNVVGIITANLLLIALTKAGVSLNLR